MEDSNFLFDAGQQANIAQEHFRRIYNNRARIVTLGLPSLYDFSGKAGGRVPAFVPWLPGDINFFVASSGNGKSSFFSWNALDQARRIKAAGEGTNTAVVLVVTETVIEKAYFKFASHMIGIDYAEFLIRMMKDNLMDGMWERLEDYGMRHASLPLWIIGKSAARPDKGLQIDIPLMTQAINRLTGTYRVHLLMIDHMHDIEDSSRADQVEKYSLIATACRDKLAHGFGVATWVAAQANNDVDTRGKRRDQHSGQGGDPVPESNEAQWCPSKLKQVGDNIWSGVRVPLYRREGEEISFNGKAMAVTGNTQYLLAAVKQRDGDRCGRMLYWRPDVNRFSDEPLPEIGKQIVELNPKGNYA